MLLDNEIVPILVFDSSATVAKDDTMKLRREQRHEFLMRAEKALSSGFYGDAAIFMKKTSSISKEFIELLLAKLNELNVKYILAPYEADSQLAFLCHEG